MGVYYLRAYFRRHLFDQLMDLSLSVYIAKIRDRLQYCVLQIFHVCQFLPVYTKKSKRLGEDFATSCAIVDPVLIS